MEDSLARDAWDGAVLVGFLEDLLGNEGRLWAPAPVISIGGRQYAVRGDRTTTRSQILIKPHQEAVIQWLPAEVAFDQDTQLILAGRSFIRDTEEIPELRYLHAELNTWRIFPRQGFRWNVVTSAAFQEMRNKAYNRAERALRACLRDEFEFTYGATDRLFRLFREFGRALREPEDVLRYYLHQALYYRACTDLLNEETISVRAVAEDLVESSEEFERRLEEFMNIHRRKQFWDVAPHRAPREPQTDHLALPTRSNNNELDHRALAHYGIKYDERYLASDGWPLESNRELTEGS